MSNKSRPNPSRPSYVFGSKVFPDLKEPFLEVFWGEAPLLRVPPDHPDGPPSDLDGALLAVVPVPQGLGTMKTPDGKMVPLDAETARIARLYVPDPDSEYSPPREVLRALDALGTRKVRYRYLPEWEVIWDGHTLDERLYIWDQLTFGEADTATFQQACQQAPTAAVRPAEEPVIQSEDITYHLRLFWGYRARMDTLGYDLCNLPEDAPQHIRQAAESLGQDTAEYRTFNGFNSMNWKPPQVRVHPPSRIYVYLPNESEPEWSFQTDVQPENARQIANTINLCRNVIPDNGAEPRRLPRSADAEFAVQRLPSLNFYGRTKYGEPLFRYSDPPTYVLDALREPLWPGEVWNPLMSWYDYCRENHRIWPRGAELDGQPIAFFSAPARDAYKAMCEEYKPAYQKMMVQKSQEHAEKMDDLRDEYWPPWGFSG